MFTEEQLRIVKFCADEIVRQRDSALEVSNLVCAWGAAVESFDNKDDMTVELIQYLAFLAKPTMNAGGYRRVNLHIGDSDVAKFPRWELVPRMMYNLVNWDRGLTPLEFYREFEEIHPFRDGNGRTGKILYNWLNGSLRNPQIPPVPREWKWSIP